MSVQLRDPYRGTFLEGILSAPGAVELTGVLGDVPPVPQRELGWVPYLIPFVGLFGGIPAALLTGNMLKQHLAATGQQPIWNSAAQRWELPAGTKDAVDRAIDAILKGAKIGTAVVVIGVGAWLVAKRLKAKR